MALVRFDDLQDEAARAEIEALTRGYADRTEYFVETLARGLSRIAAFCHPKPVIVRMSDFKTNEYAELLGGRQFEPHEENPMIGFRGASRYYSDALPRRLRARVPGDPAGARDDGLHERHRDDPVLPHARRGGPGARGDGRERARARARTGSRST